MYSRLYTYVQFIVHICTIRCPPRSRQRPPVGTATDNGRARSLFVSLDPHQGGIALLEAVEHDGTAVVPHFGERTADVALLCLGDGAPLLPDVVIGGIAETRHDPASDAGQVGGAHVVVDMRDAPCVCLAAVGHEERARLAAGYHGGIGNGVGGAGVSAEHLVGGVAEASAGLPAMRSGAVDKVPVEPVVFFLCHNASG